LLLIVLIIVVTFCLNNNNKVVLSLNPLPYEIEIKLFLLIALSVLIGLIGGFLLLSKSLLYSKIKNFINDKKVKKLQKEM